MNDPCIPGIQRNVQNMQKTIQEWTLENPVLLPGQIGIVSDIPGNPFKFGDGSTKWNDLLFQNEFPNHKYSGSGMRELMPAGSLFEVPEYTVYPLTILNVPKDDFDHPGEILPIKGNLLVYLSGIYCWERHPDYTGLAYTKINCYRPEGGIHHSWVQVGNIGEKSRYIKFWHEIKPVHSIEIRYFPNGNDLGSRLLPGPNTITIDGGIAP